MSEQARTIAVWSSVVVTAASWLAFFSSVSSQKSTQDYGEGIFVALLLGLVPLGQLIGALVYHFAPATRGVLFFAEGAVALVAMGVVALMVIDGSQTARRTAQFQREQDAQARAFAAEAERVRAEWHDKPSDEVVAALGGKNDEVLIGILRERMIAWRDACAASPEATRVVTALGAHETYGYGWREILRDLDGVCAALRRPWISALAAGFVEHCASSPGLSVSSVAQAIVSADRSLLFFDRIFSTLPLDKKERVAVLYQLARAHETEALAHALRFGFPVPYLGAEPQSLPEVFLRSLEVKKPGGHWPDDAPPEDRKLYAELLAAQAGGK
jgi:hypothetical protein